MIIEAEPDVGINNLLNSEALKMPGLKVRSHECQKKVLALTNI